MLYHRPRMAYGISVLEFQNGETHWTEGICPENYSKLIETTDEGDLYYRSFFFGQGKKSIIFLNAMYQFFFFLHTLELSFGGFTMYNLFLQLSC